MADTSAPTSTLDDRFLSFVRLAAGATPVDRTC
jgi:hypothetical protein